MRLAMPDKARRKDSRLAKGISWALSSVLVVRQQQRVTPRAETVGEQGLRHAYLVQENFLVVARHAEKENFRRVRLAGGQRGDLSVQETRLAVENPFIDLEIRRLFSLRSFGGGYPEIDRVVGIERGVVGKIAGEPCHETEHASPLRIGVPHFTRIA
ncbi:MAG: hypothetical protein LBQ62_09525 [Candidatus Accumulibacter sp.]|jgi:hypothetical protein|nr:hypothetical protein [Accumulibacter sp.]